MSVRRIEVRERVMARNDALAAQVRARLADAGIAAVNLVSSPGAGKTALLERTLAAMDRELGIAVVTADVQTANDAERLEQHTARLVHAVVTGGACHMDALQVTDALDALPLSELELLVLENVGNLVCPSNWDLGEQARVTLFAVTEGEDKPLKYPKAFARADVVVLTKVDLLPYLRFDLVKAVEAVRAINPTAELLFTSSETGEGLDEWFDWLRAQVARHAAVRRGAAV